MGCVNDAFGVSHLLNKMQFCCGTLDLLNSACCR